MTHYADSLFHAMEKIRELERRVKELEVQLFEAGVVCGEQMKKCAELEAELALLKGQPY